MPVSSKRSNFMKNVNHFSAVFMISKSFIFRHDVYRTPMSLPEAFTFPLRSNIITAKSLLSLSPACKMCASILPPILPRSLPQWVLPRVPPALPAHSHTPQPALTRHQPRDSLTPEPPSPLLEFSQLPFLYHTLALPLFPSMLTCCLRNEGHSQQKMKACVVRYEVREV